MNSVKLPSTEKLFQECFEKILGIVLSNRSVTTTSIYCKMPDGYGLRIGDHKGKEKYKYKWNLDPKLFVGYWKKEYNETIRRDCWRYYTGNVDDLISMYNGRKRKKE